MLDKVPVLWYVLDMLLDFVQEVALSFTEELRY